jgi:eukaryotic-like serine/threonine-protein kinase
LVPRFGNCRVLAELRSGALSSVYHALQEPLGRDVAVKALKPSISISSSFATELLREAQILGELRHPNVALLYELVKTSSELYLVMEYVAGPELSELLSRRPKLAPEAGAIIGAAIARGLEHAHERGVVHRDVKPGNVLISLRGEVKLIDFGIARKTRGAVAHEPPEAESLAFGTPAYMSPEQILGDTADARSDLFSLGVVLYQMLTGVRPFEGDDVKDRRASTQRIRRAPAVPLRSRAPDVPRPLERIVMKLLEKLPADRFASAGALAQELEEIVSLRVRGSPLGVVARALREAGFARAQAPTGEVTEAVEPPLRPTYLGFAAILAAGVSGILAVELGDSEDRETAHAGEAPLELVPHAAASLRVLATPWADVSIDGEHIDTTPFARAIPLAPGRHFVTLTHPDAPPEQRAIRLGPGESQLLEVTMRLETGGGSDTRRVDAADDTSSRGGS